MPGRPKPPTSLACGWLAACALAGLAGCGGRGPEVETLAQILEAVQQPENRPSLIWKAEGSWHIGPNGHGGGGFGGEFRNSPSGRLERFLTCKGLADEPLGLLGLLDSPDPEQVLTGARVYLFRDLGRLAMTPEQNQQVADEVRSTCLGHKDVRVRWAGYQGLIRKGWLMLPDLERALADADPAIRVTAAFYLRTLIAEDFAYSPAGKLVTGQNERIEETLRTRSRLVHILLRHLNDEHFFVRYSCYSGIRQRLTRRVKGGRGVSYQVYPKMPAKIDWVRADWQTRLAAQEDLSQWWDLHAEEALRWALPHPAEAGTDKK